MEALQEWIEMERFITTLWFLTKCGRIQLLSLSLYEDQALSLSLSKYLSVFLFNENLISFQEMIKGYL